MDTIFLTKEKRTELENDLRTMQIRGRAEIAQKIADARSHGDLSENADYDAAKDEQALFELKIAKLAEMLAHSEVIDASDFVEGEVHIFSVVKVKHLTSKKIMQFTIVSDAESDFEQNKISTNSPLGRALLGKKVGDFAEIKVPAGIQKYEVLEIA